MALAVLEVWFMTKPVEKSLKKIPFFKKIKNNKIKNYLDIYEKKTKQKKYQKNYKKSRSRNIFFFQKAKDTQFYNKKRDSFFFYY